MEQKVLRELPNYDFYSGNRKSFYEKNSHRKAILVQGRHWEKPPEVTILLPTYKRCDLLKEALESALHQEEVQDYQIIVADNEGIPVQIETETSMLMKNYQDERVIYYRYDRQTIHAMDSVAALARSKWICFLHDDDVLAPNYLRIMLHIVKSHKEISYLACNIGVLKNTISERNIRQFSKIPSNVVTIQKAIRRGYYFYEVRMNWIGAFIDRRRYIDMGGIPELATGIGDHIMIGKYNMKYGIYRIIDGPRLYFRRAGGKGQLTASGGDMWTDCYTSELYFYYFLAKRFFPCLRKFFEYKGLCMIQRNILGMRNGLYRIPVDIETIKSRCHVVEPDEKTKRKYYYIDLLLQSMAERYQKKNRFQTSLEEGEQG